jgi:hypothetical protein
MLRNHSITCLISKCKACHPVKKFLWSHFRSRNRYPHEVVEESSNYLSFKRLTSNVSDVIALTDDLRKRPKKFICINDETDFERTEGRVSKIIIHSSN